MVFKKGETPKKTSTIEEQQRIDEKKIFEIPKNITQKESQAERRRILFKVHKGLLRKKQKLVEFDEPILILMREGKKAEFYEKATGGKFIFSHSDGDERFIILDQSFMQTFEYGGKVFSGYICHEDFPTPLPENPIVTTELVALLYEKTLNDIKKWKIEELKAKKGLRMVWVWIILAIGAVIVLILIFKEPTNTTTIIENATNIANNTEIVTILPWTQPKKTS